jgi:acetyl-CoA C-acetyltransferase
MNDPVVIVGASRTAIGSFQGALAALPAPALGAAALRGAIAGAGIAADQIEETVMGCVLPAGQGQAPARQASIGAGVPMSTPCTTVNKMCGSGMKAVMLAHDAILAGSVRVAAAGGMESMSNAPYLLLKARAGLRLGHGEVLDHMFIDGLEDAYDKGRLMGSFAEDCAARFEFSREEQDAYAIESLKRAHQAIAEGAFRREIVPVTARGRDGETAIEIDEQPGRARLDRIPQLKPAFRPDGTVTAANSSSISDGAAALILMKASEAARRGLKPIARIAGHASHAQEPGWFTTAPIGAIRALLDRIGWTREEIDLYEINEAFAVVAMAAMAELELDHAKLNVRGGACALGHPVGASGARILVTLLRALEDRGGRRGVASLCIGGGEATAMALELL